MDLYSELLQTKKENNQKEITDLMKMIKSLQRSNLREKDDLAASHKETILRLIKAHEMEVDQATDDLRRVSSIRSIAYNYNTLEIQKRDGGDGSKNKETAVVCAMSAASCSLLLLEYELL